MVQRQRRAHRVFAAVSGMSALLTAALLLSAGAASAAQGGGRIEEIGAENQYASVISQISGQVRAIENVLAHKTSTEQL